MSPVTKIRNAGFTLELDGDDLTISPFSKLTTRQTEFLKFHKAEIIEELRQEQAANVDRDPGDDRRFCHECLRLINGRCTASKTRYHPVDTHPRRCADFIEGSK
jgi:hypothetical protein